MKIRYRVSSITRFILVGFFLAVLMQATPGNAQAILQDENPPFILPFARDPGPSTWLFIQAYGNTTFAYRYRNSVYYGGQGIHFGIDLAAPCGTEILAIGDGVINSVDSWHGAGPHNLMINHANGYASFYGHLLVRASVRPGQIVKAGEVVGLSGDPDRTCNSRPHLHLEIRDSETHALAFNPISLIKADWERIAQYGGHPIGFQQASDDTRRWTSFFDQPETKFGHPLLNRYEKSWPDAW